MADIFVSYRRSDSSDVTGRIFDHLRQRFGETHLFKDVESIPFGADFRKEIARAVHHCDVLLTIIGRQWLEAKSDSGSRRIDDPDDYVHLEIVSALARDIPVIPVLVQDAPIPKASDLPAALQPLAYRNAARVRTDPDFRNDMDALCAQLSKHVVGDTLRRDELPATEDQHSSTSGAINTVSHSKNSAVSVGGNVMGGTIVTGDHNVTSLQLTQTTLPTAETVDIQFELNAVRRLLQQLQSADASKIDRALEDAEDEAKKSDPDRDELGDALDRALKYARKAEGFAKVATSIKGHITKVAAWLGNNWHKLLPLVGLTL